MKSKLPVELAKEVSTFQKGVHYVVIPELPEEQQALFTKWLDGQTVPIVGEEGENKFKCAYKWDYDQWYASWSKGKTAIVWN